MILLKSVYFNIEKPLKSVDCHAGQEDYSVHSALDNLLKNPDYHILSGTVISNA